MPRRRRSPPGPAVAGRAGTTAADGEIGSIGTPAAHHRRPAWRYLPSVAGLAGSGPRNCSCGPIFRRPGTAVGRGEPVPSTPCTLLREPSPDDAPEAGPVLLRPPAVRAGRLDPRPGPARRRLGDGRREERDRLQPSGRRVSAVVRSAQSELPGEVRRHRRPGVRGAVARMGCGTRRVQRRMESALRGRPAVEPLRERGGQPLRPERRTTDLPGRQGRFAVIQFNVRSNDLPKGTAPGSTTTS